MTVDLTAIEIERRLTAIETTLETRLPTFATKADVNSLKADIQAVGAEWEVRPPQPDPLDGRYCDRFGYCRRHHCRANRPVRRRLNGPEPEQRSIRIGPNTCRQCLLRWN